MRRPVLLLGAFAIIVASCGGGSDTASSTSTSSESPVTTSPVTTTPVTTSPATTSPPGVEAPATTVPAVEGPAAPDFTLALGDGGEFTLSAEEKPVYLIFWAEW
jgi:hypothetical protein